jgi:undecaprenyl pyrophosphate phosphatase UppP
MNYYHGKKDKTGLYFVLLIIFGFLASATATWAVVEFILYLVKDHVFNWTSVWLTVAAVVLEIYFFVKMTLSD